MAGASFRAGQGGRGCETGVADSGSTDDRVRVLPPNRTVAPDDPGQARIAEHAHLRSMVEYQRLYPSLDDPPCSGASSEADRLVQPPQSPGRRHEPADFTWFGGAVLNACVNCVDRHAIGSPGGRHHLGGESREYRDTYRELRRTWRVWNVLLALGVGRGDRSASTCR